MRRRIVTTPFDRDRIPPKQNPLALPFIWLFCFLMTRRGKLKIRKYRMKGLKPPFLVLGTHQAFMDFYVTPLALFPHRANYVSELEGFESFGEWAYRQIGCLGTRKFVNDMALVKNIRRVIERKGILVFYPEARYANVGTSSKFPPSVGKLAKLLNAPVVAINMHGNYLRSPIWNLTVRKEARLEAELTQLFTREELEGSTDEEVQRRLEEALSYDEYAWQYEKRIRITHPKRAEGLELPLYQCLSCGREFQMRSENADLYCHACKARWHMDEYGRLELRGNGGTGKSFEHIPDWYEWEREQVKEEICRGVYRLEVRIRIESLPNAVNFIDLGEGTLIHSLDGFSLTFTEFGETREKTLLFTPASMFSVHTEYDYRGKGPCITLSSGDNTYFLFPRGAGFNPTKIQFATEYLWERAHRLSDRMKRSEKYEKN